jgi:hypothetical protein
VTDVVSPSSAMGFDSKMSEKHKSTSPSVIQMENWQKTSSTEEKLNIIS